MKSLTEQQIMELAAQNQHLRICLDKLARLGNEPYLGNSLGNKIAAEALALPDLASHMLNRVKAEALRSAADEFDAQGEYIGHEQQLRQMADAIEKGEG